MTDAFIHVPEQHAGKPMTIDEAREFLSSMTIVPNYRAGFEAMGLGNAERGIKLLVQSSLKAGLESFVQLSATGRWMRIPKSYWSDTDRDFLIFQGMNAVGSDPDMIGQPIVIWDSSIYTILMVAGDLGEALLERALTSAELSDLLGLVWQERNSAESHKIVTRRRRVTTPSQAELGLFFALQEHAGGLQATVKVLMDNYAKWHRRKEGVPGRTAFRNGWAVTGTVNTRLQSGQVTTYQSKESGEQAESRDYAGISAGLDELVKSAYSRIAASQCP